jgi:creatinine amidohydrolase
MRVRSRGVLLVLCLLLAGVTTASTQPPDTVFLEELTWTELRDLVRSGTTTILLPAGGTEQNGPHMALGKHNVRARSLSEKIARRLGHTLVAPVLAYVPEGPVAPPAGHMRFPGTITVPDEVFRQTLASAGRSFKLHGFREIVLLGDHGDTQAALEAVARSLNREWASTGVRAHAIVEYYRAGDVEFRQLLRMRGYRDAELGAHAGLLDTSLMLAIDPRLVRPEQMKPGPRDQDGVDGDPSRASADLGRLGEALIVTRAVEAIRRSTARR